MKNTRRLGSLLLLALTVGAVLAMAAAPAGATPYQAPTPPGPVNGSGNFEGTEAVLNETLGGPPCFFTNTKTIFALRGVGTFAGVTAAGSPVAYTTSIDANQALYADGPVQIEVESTVTYHHGPNGTFGPVENPCISANVGSPVPAVVRLFAPDHIYNLDGGGAQVPCTGTGQFARGNGWQAD